MKNKTTIISILSILLTLSGCGLYEKENTKFPESRGMTIPNHFVEDITEEEIEAIQLEYSINFPAPYTIEMSPGEKKIETIEIKNTGLNADTFVFEGEYRRDQNKWADFSTLPEATYLKSGKKINLTFKIAIPEDTEINSTISFTVRARRQVNDEIIGSTDMGIIVVDQK